MARYFNTTGPCMPRLHYMLPPADRLIGASLERYIRDELYWVLHAPRQTGKTTFLQSWMREINAGEESIACYVSLECCQGVPETEIAIPAMVSTIIESAARNNMPIPPLVDGPCETRLNRQLAEWATRVAPKKLIVLFDEVDVVEGPALVSLLRQLRSGFAGRGVGKFPVSVALVGMRDLRDYLVRSKDGLPVNPGSPFNIKEDSVTLGNFSRGDIAALTAQYTEEHGQRFEVAALDRIWSYTSGQPWLVNALCKECVLRVTPEGMAVISAHVDDAKDRLILARATHIDSLGERLKDPRVRKVIEPMITGSSDDPVGRSDRDVELCLDLGLIAWEGSLVIANAIYREVIARYLSQNYQDNVPQPQFKWQRDDGGLDMDALLAEFQKFWAWHSEIWEEKADYTEAFPHLLLMGFLQRIINGGGMIDREYAAGRGRVDLGIRFGGRTNIVEIKLVHPRMGREATMAQGLEQIARYANTMAADTRHLVIFDRRPEARAKPWDARLSCETRTSPDGQPVHVVWC